MKYVAIFEVGTISREAVESLYGQKVADILDMDCEVIPLAEYMKMLNDETYPTDAWITFVE